MTVEHAHVAAVVMDRGTGCLPLIDQRDGGRLDLFTLLSRQPPQGQGCGQLGKFNDFSHGMHSQQTFTTFQVPSANL